MFPPPAIGLPGAFSFTLGRQAPHSKTPPRPLVNPIPRAACVRFHEDRGSLLSGIRDAPRSAARTDPENQGKGKESLRFGRPCGRLNGQGHQVIQKKRVSWYRYAFAKKRCLLQQALIHPVVAAKCCLLGRFFPATFEQPENYSVYFGR